MKSLDIGAGIGKQMIALSKSGFETYGLEPSKQHFGSDFFASLHRAKLIQFFFNFSLTIYFYQLYLQSCATSTRGLRKGGLMC